MLFAVTARKIDISGRLEQLERLDRRVEAQVRVAERAVHGAHEHGRQPRPSGSSRSANVARASVTSCSDACSSWPMSNHCLQDDGPRGTAPLASFAQRKNPSANSAARVAG
jgi:hypothetical protein